MRSIRRRLAPTALFLCITSLIGLVGQAQTQDPSPEAMQHWKEFAQGGGRMETASGFLILPVKRPVGSSIPWVWYAPVIQSYFPRLETDWLLTRLLQKGIAVAGMDVGESYGSPKGVEQFTGFYQSAVAQYNLSPKPCLLAQSRGGLMLFNWAIANPQRVQCIAGIFAVSNIASYPGLDRARGAYGMEAGEFREKYRLHNPIDTYQPLVAARIPILLLHGDSDDIVPMEVNSQELDKRYRSAGGNSRLIVMKGKSHKRDPAFFESQDLLDFLISQVGR